MDKERLKKEMIRLVEIMETLRGPEGCPWDKKQDYYSLQPYILEEAYEVVEALQKKDLKALREELGDLLLQVVFESQIGSEKGDFTLIDVLETINNKLIRRHPHVFTTKEKKTISEQKEIWENIKNKEKDNSFTSILDGLSRNKPALNQAYEIQDKAAEVGFDWNKVEDVLGKIEEELNEVKEAMERNNTEEISEELGDLLFAVVNLTRFYNIDPEISLLKTVLKFKERFKHIETRVMEKGYKLENLTLSELDYYWEESKNKIH